MPTRLLYSNDRGALEQEGWWGTVLNAASKRPWVKLPRAFVFDPVQFFTFGPKNRVERARRGHFFACHPKRTC